MLRIFPTCICEDEYPRPVGGNVLQDPIKLGVQCGCATGETDFDSGWSPISYPFFPDSGWEWRCRAFCAVDITTTRAPTIAGRGDLQRIEGREGET